MAIHMFQQLIDTLKKSPKRIVFTEGTDARILEASARLLAGTWLAPILIGNEAEVKAAAEEVGFNIRGAEIIDPATYPDMDKMVEEMVAMAENDAASRLAVFKRTSDMLTTIINEDRNHLSLVQRHGWQGTEEGRHTGDIADKPESKPSA